MNIIVFGATGSLGRVIVDQALADGHTVTAFTRGADYPNASRDGLTVKQGDIFNPADVAGAIKGHDAVICALGAGRKGVVRATGTKHIMAGMKQHGVSRFVCLSSLGVGDSVGNLNFFWKNIMFGLLLRPAFADHIKQEELVRQSDLDWTIVRPAAFTDGPRTGQYQHGFSGTQRDGLSLKVSRADIADFMLGQLNTDTYLHRAASLSY